MSREYVAHFNRLTLGLLSEQERQQLYRSLQSYQKNRDIIRFALTVKEICRTPEKARLLEYVRGYVPKSDKFHFDKLTGYRFQEHMTGMTANSRLNLFGRITAPANTAVSSTTERLVTIQGSRGTSMGFSIRGGSEFGLGIYVSNVKAGSPADKAGLRAGDHIVTANGIDFHSVANSSAIKVLTNSELLKLNIFRVGKIPEWKVARERILWYDVALCRIVSSPPVSETKSVLGQHNVLVDRKVVVAIDKETDFIGLNIRGGREYGIGIYSSRIDPGGLAEQVGIAAGDQIIKVNDVDCTSLSHSDAVDALRSSAHLIITIRSVGKYPVFKELYAEYTWSDASSLSTTTSGVIVRSRLVTAPDDSSPLKYSHRTQTRESSIDLTPSTFGRSASDINNSYLDGTLDEMVDVDDESQVCYPGDNDIMFRKNHEDTWRNIDTMSDNYARVDSLGKSWSPDKLDSLGHYHQDSDLDVLDYTSFLEHTSLKDKQENRTHKQIDTSSELNDDNVVIETVVEEKITSFSSKPHMFRSMSSDSDVFHPENSIHVYSQVQDLTGKSRSRGSFSHNPESAPIYATVNKKSRKKSSDSIHSLAMLGNGIYGDNNYSYSSHRDQIPLDDVIESQIERLEARKSHLGTWEITRVAEDTTTSSKSSSVGSYESQDKNKTGTWTSLKKKLKGSLRVGPQGNHKKRSSMPDVEAYAGGYGTSASSGSLQQNGKFERSFGSMILNSHNSDRYNLMGMLEDHARVLLNDDEYRAVIRHIHNYHENKDLDRLVELLLVILDKEEKRLLLVDVRNVIAPSHIARYDNLVAHCNMQGYEKFVSKFNFTGTAGNGGNSLGNTVQGKSKNYTNAHTSKMYDVNNHKPHTSGHNAASPRKDFEYFPGSLEVVLVESNDVENRKIPIVENGEEIVYISKHKTILGLDICGGRNDQNDQSIRVKQIIGEGAAADDKRLQPGVQITKVDGKCLQGLSCEEAKSMLQIAFSTKLPVNLGIHIKRA